MNQWALLKDGKIVNVVTTNTCRRHMQEQYPDYEIISIYSLSDEVRQEYRYWNERP